MPDASELGAWLRLTLTPTVGRTAARRLLAAFGSPEAVFDAVPAAQREVAGATVAAALARPLEDHADRCRSVLAWLKGGEQRTIVTLGEALYPPLLLQTADPPVLLYLLGDTTQLAAASVAVVGSRKPSAQGIDNARRFASSLAQEGLVVVSGLALGIDGAAHEGALAGGGCTVAVVGTGLDIVYPTRHAELARRIAARGVLVSEFPPGTPALPANFPQRNRIIAGLSLGTLVVEAALRSGSLITARLAAEAGREVFAVPGSIHALQSKGCHALIRDGAKLVETVADVVEELRLSAPAEARAAVAAPPTAAAGRPDPVLDALGFDPVTLDALGARTGWPTSDLLARLLELELDGQVARLPGGLYQRRNLA